MAKVDLLARSWSTGPGGGLGSSLVALLTKLFDMSFLDRAGGKVQGRN